MKIKKMLLVSLLGAALVVTGCNNKKPSSSPLPSSETAKVAERITVGQVTSAVVGDVLDLDNIVEVTYNDGSKDKTFEVSVRAASQNLVSVEGHKVTFIKEGTVTIDIKNGERTAIFETSVVSALKKALMEATNVLSNNFGYFELAFDEQGEITGASHHATHNENYTTFAGWDDNETPSVTTDDLPGGFIRTKSGSCYQYTLDTNYQNINVDPTPQSAFDDYYVDMPFSFDVANCVTMTEGEGDDAFDYLHLAATHPAGYSFFENSAVEFCYCSLALYFGAVQTASYIVESIDVYPVAMSETEDRFVFQVNVQRKSDGQMFDGGAYLLIYENDGMYGIPAVQAYYDSGAEPAGVNPEPLKNKFASLLTAKNFTASIALVDEVRNPSTGALISEEALYNEEIFANESIYQDAIYDASDDSLVAGEGLVEHEGSLYSFTYNGTTNPATLIGAGKTIYADGLSATVCKLTAEAYWTEFFVPAMNTVEGVDVYQLGVSKNQDFILDFLGVTYAGSPILNWRNYIITNAEVDLLADGYATSYIAISESVFIFNLNIFGGNSAEGYHYYDFTVNFTAIGTTAAIGTVITYPEA